ncbi:MAG TPA: C45 family peptidase [Patescibacteria group bacterium]|nr:C45 family peptidase [Patescibacteria group bacterium]
MYHPRLKGSYYDMGFKYGSLLFKNGFRLPHTEARKVEFGMKCLNEIAPVYPEIIREFEGFAEGAQSNIEQLAGFVLSIGAFEHEAQCSLFASRNKSGEMIVGRNFDSFFTFQKFTESSLIAPENKLSYIAQSEVFIGREDGINEAGLFIGMSYVNGRNPLPGFNFLISVRYCLEHFTTVDEVIHFFKNIPIATYNNFLVADRSDMAVIEVCPQTVQVRHPENNFIVCTNYFQHPEVKKFEAEGVGWSKPIERFCAASDFLSSNEDMNTVLAKQILSDRKKHLCLHLARFQFGTLWSVVANLTTMEIFRAEGLPTVKKYKPEARLHQHLNRRKSVHRSCLNF